jgi:hypothetical protein
MTRPLDLTRLYEQNLAAGRLQLLSVPHERLEVLAQDEKGRNSALGVSYERSGAIDPATGDLCSTARIHARGECRDSLGFIDSKEPHTGDEWPCRNRAEVRAPVA